MTVERFNAAQCQLGMLLRDQPLTTAADLCEFAVAYWDGRRVFYVFLHDDGSARLDEEFELSDFVWEEWEPTFLAWFDRPTYSVRPELGDWLKNAARREAAA